MSPQNNDNDGRELLALAATQLNKATAATTHLLDRNDAQVQSLSERIAILETQRDAIHARLKKIEAVIDGTLTDKGLKERYHYVETEIKRIVDYMKFMDAKFKDEFFQHNRQHRTQRARTPVFNSAMLQGHWSYVLTVAVVTALIAFGTMWYVSRNLSIP